MAETSKQSVGWPGTVPSTAASFPVAKAAPRIDDEDEWEYEYSSTETEVRLWPELLLLLQAALVTLVC